MNNQTYLMGIVSLFSIQSPQIFANENTIYPFIAASVVKQSSFITNDNQEFTFSYTPKISLGFALDYDFSQNWQLTNNIYLSYMNGKFTADNNMNGTNYGRVVQKGLWVSSRLKRLNIMENVNPFLELGVGIVDVDYSDLSNQQEKLTTDYKAIAGFEYKTITDTTISIGLGYAKNK